MKRKIKFLKGILSLTLVTLMVLSCVPMSVFAYEPTFYLVERWYGNSKDEMHVSSLDYALKCASEGTYGTVTLTDNTTVISSNGSDYFDVPENVVLKLNGYIFENNGIINFANIDCFDAGGGSYIETGYGEVRIGNKAAKICLNQLYYAGSNIDSCFKDGYIDVNNLTENTCYTAGGGYVGYKIVDGKSVINLSNATITGPGYESDDGNASVFSTDSALEINFSGENNLSCGKSYTSIGLNVADTLILNGIGDNAVLNVKSGEAVSGDSYGISAKKLFIKSGTVNATSNTSSDVNIEGSIFNHGTLVLTDDFDIYTIKDKISGNGVIRIGESDYTVVDNNVYYAGGDIHDLFKWGYVDVNNLKADACYTAGDGYVVYKIVDGKSVINLNNATITGPEYLSGDCNTSVFRTESDLEINFSGENNLTCGKSNSTDVFFAENGLLALNGIGDNAVLNLKAGEAISGDSRGIIAKELVINSGTVNATANDSTSGAYGVSVFDRLTVAQGAVLNACGIATGENAYASCGVSCSTDGEINVEGTINAIGGKASLLSLGVYRDIGSTISGNGTLNGLSIFPNSEDLKYEYSVLGDAEIAVDFKPLVDESIIATFTVAEGTSLTIDEGATADLSALATSDITIDGAVVNNGTLILPDDFDIDSIKDNVNGKGVIKIGESEYVVVDNNYYNVGGDIHDLFKEGFININDLSDNTCYTAGDGYVVYKIIDGKSVINLNNATITGLDASGDTRTSVFRSESFLEINFSGENNLSCGRTCTSAGIDVRDTLVLNGIGEDAVLNITGGEAYSGDSYGMFVQELIINSGTVNATANKAANTSVGVGANSLTVAEGAVLNGIGGISDGETVKLSCGFVSSDVTNNGTINGLGVISDFENRIYNYSVFGNTVLNIDCIIEKMDDFASTFTVEDGTSLTIAEDVTVDMSALSASDVHFNGRTEVNGTLILPADTKYEDVKYSFDTSTPRNVVYIGEKKYSVYNAENNGVLGCENLRLHNWKNGVCATCDYICAHWQVVNGYCTKYCGAYMGADKVAGYSISLGGNVAVNYHMQLSADTINDKNAKMVFTVPESGSTYTVEIPVSEAVETEDGYFVFTCDVAAKEMTSKISAQVVTSNGESEVFEYTVKEYAEVILADPDTYGDAVGIVKAMLNYGANAQQYFGCNTDDLANDTQYISEDEKVLSDVDLGEYAYTVSGEQTGVSFYGALLSLESETAIKLFFRFENEADAEALEITVNGEKVAAVKNGSYYEIKISDIPAHKLSDMYEIKVGGLTLNYGVFSYGNLAMNTTKESLKNTIKALYAYSQVAAAYNG